MAQESIISELALCIAELHDRVRRLQEENQDLVHQLGKSDTRINQLRVDNERLKSQLKAKSKPYKDKNARILSDKEALDELKRRMESTPYDDENSATRNAKIYDGQVMDELKRTMTEPSPYEGTNSTDGVDTCPGKIAEESVVDTHLGHIANKFPQCVAYTSADEVVPSINPNATTAD